MPNNPNASHPFPGPISPQGGQTLSSTCSEVTTVQVASGNLTKALSLVHVPTVGLPLDFALYYTGSAWTHTYDQYLTFQYTQVVSPEYEIDDSDIFCYNTTWELESVTYTGEGGQQFVFDAGGDTVSAGTRFMPCTLSLSGVYTYTGATITFPNGAYYEFANVTDSDYTNLVTCTDYLLDTTSGITLAVRADLTGMVDPYGNTTTITWTDGVITAITEPTGRSITLGYTSGVLTSVTDPNSNEYTLSDYPGLSEVSGPEGCIISYGYTSGALTSMTDPDSHTWSYSYTSGQLTGVTSPEASENTISYAFDTTTEGWATGVTFNRTKLTDARGNVWEYHFDPSNNLWRSIDPLGHHTRHFWDQNQRLLFSTAPFAPGTENWDNPYNRFAYATYDSSGNKLLSIDPMGRMTQRTFNAQNQVTSVTPGRGNLSIQGNWANQFGQDGYVLCGFAPGSDSRGLDVSSLPSYISSISYLDSGPSDSVRSHLAESSYYQHYLDSATPQAATLPQKALGYWTSTSSFDVTINAAATVTYNLSVYANSADIAETNVYPYRYDEQTGRDVTFTVTDKVGTQTFRVYSDAPGAWVTFPVSSDTTHPVTITIAPSGGNAGSAQIGVMAFDPYDNHTSTFTYNSEGDILTATDPLSNESSWTYNTNGTLETFTDARSKVTHFYYDDTYLNMTRVVDALSNTWTMTYDLNGNALTVENPLSRTWTFTYDGKNRLLTATDPLSNETQWNYDDAGNLLNVIDANSNETQFSYSPSNRLTQITDALSQLTKFGWDGSGNLITFQTPNDVAASLQTAFQWDDAERMTQTTLAQETGSPTTFYAQMGVAYDGLNQVRAITPPNGMQSPLSLVNLAGAQNWLSNAGMEIAAPYSGGAPLRWGQHASQTTSKAHSGAASLQSSVTDLTEYANQTPIYARAGEKLIANGWVASNATGSGPEVWLGLVTPDETATMDEATSATQAAPLSTAGWQELGQTAFQVPGDGQYPRFPVSEMRLHSSISSGSLSTWWDDMTLNSVSPSVNYDLAGRPTQSTSPTGAQRNTLYDRYNRVSRMVDPNGNAVTMTWDGKNQLLSITDALGNTTTFEYDAVGSLTQVTDARSNATQYAYDDLNRLETITYPDSSTESFTYDNAGNLYTYENARSQTRTFAYDHANRLMSVTYSDSTTVAYTYDNMTHVATRTDRNGDVTTFTYDDLYRVTEVQRVPGGSSPTVGWTQSIGYDANGNRTSFSSAVSSKTTQSWSVPTGGYDSLDRLVTLDDRFSNSLTMAYDVDSNRSGVTFPYGSPAPATTATFDMTDRLLSLTTSNGASNALALSTGYDLASQRLWVTADGDGIDYGYDANGQLVSERHNQWSVLDGSGFAAGTVSSTLVDPSAPSVALASLSDTFSGQVLNSDRWRLAIPSNDFVGLRVSQNDGLTLSGPSWPSELESTGDPPVTEGLASGTFLLAMENRQVLTGNFDVQVSFANYQGDLASNGSTFGSGAASGIGLRVGTQPLEMGGSSFAAVGRDAYPSYSSYFPSGGSHATTSDTSGMLRLTRSGSTITAYYWNSGTSAWVSLSTSTSLGTVPLYVSLFVQWTTYVTGTFTDFQVNGSTANYPSSGTYTSPIYDAGSSVTWQSLSWDATVPAGATLKFQVAAASSPTGTFTFKGPDGTSATYFTTSGASLPSVTGRYFQYQATMAPGSSGSTTPVLSQVNVPYSGTNASAAIVYAYDAVGNLTNVTTVSGSTTTTDVRDDVSWSSGDRINDLNQIMRQDIQVNTNFFDTWRYTYDASGNRLTKADPIWKQTCTWDEDNRLTEVVNSYLVTSDVYGTAIDGTSVYSSGLSYLPTGTVSYSYDALGRMMTRTDGSGTTTFVWDGMDLVQEFDAAGNQTRYYVVDGELLMFERTPSGGSSTTYQVISDHLGSVRKVLDSANNILAQFDTDAWGNLLASSFDNVPDGGCMYRFVGALGVRWDAGTGLYYMRQRWHDPALARFISRDRVAARNRYRYTKNNPARLIDPSGLSPAAGMAQLNPSPPSPWGTNVTPQQIAAAEAAMRARGMNFDDNNNDFNFSLSRIDPGIFFGIYGAGETAVAIATVGSPLLIYYAATAGMTGIASLGVGLMDFLNPGPCPGGKGGSFNINLKIQGQMERRGWTLQQISDVISNPNFIMRTTNLGYGPGGTPGPGTPATVYFNVTGDYVVVDDLTGQVIQISNQNDPGWLPDDGFHFTF